MFFGLFFANYGNTDLAPTKLIEAQSTIQSTTTFLQKTKLARKTLAINPITRLAGRNRKHTLL